MAVRVGVVGGGQLARMMIAPAVELGIELRVLAEEDGMSAALAATAVGDYRDAETVLAFARDVDVDHLRSRARSAGRARTRWSTAGVVVRPGPGALQYRAGQARDARASAGTRDAAARVGGRDRSPTSLQDFLDAHGGRAVVKTPRGGYDGKGVRVVVGRDRGGRLVRRARRGRAEAEHSWSRSSSISPASSPSRSRAGPPARCAPIRSSRRCSGAASAPR